MLWLSHFTDPRPPLLYQLSFAGRQDIRTSVEHNTRGQIIATSELSWGTAAVEAC
jgi:hypothetical protein